MQRLIQASLEGNVERVIALVDNAVNPRELVNKGDDRGFGALHVAVMMGAPDCAKKVGESRLQLLLLWSCCCCGMRHLFTFASVMSCVARACLPSVRPYRDVPVPRLDVS